MANPLPNENQFYDRIEKNEVKIDPDVRELLNHHIRNDVNYIACGLGQYAFVPANILEEVDTLMKKLYVESGEPGDPPPGFQELYQGIMKRCRNIVEFMNKLMNMTACEGGEDA